MSHKSSKRGLCIILDDISKLEKQRLELDHNISKKKKYLSKSKNLRNKYIFKGALKMLTPVVISSIVVYGTSVLTGFGRPFVLDNEKSSKVYTIVSSPEKGISAEENYKIITRRNDIPKSTFSIKSPWVEKDNYYERNVYNYEEKNLDDVGLYDAVLAHDFKYIYDNYKFISEDIETCSSLNLSYLNSEKVITANIYIVDKNDNIYCMELPFRNNMITLFELLIVIFSSSLVIFGIKDKIFEDISKYSYAYSIDKENYKDSLEKMKKLDFQIARLKRKVAKNEK